MPESMITCSQYLRQLWTTLFYQGLECTTIVVITLSPQDI